MLRPPKIHDWIQLNLWSKRVIVKLEVKCPWDGYENLPLNLKSGKLMTSSILVFSIPLYYFLNVNQKPQTESSLGSMCVWKFSQFPAVFSVPSHPFSPFFPHLQWARNMLQYWDTSILSLKFLDFLKKQSMTS